MYEFRMPSLGADMEAGTLSRWLVHPGDAVKRGDVVALIETEKSDIEVEIFAAGVVEQLVVEEGQRVPVGTLLARVRTNGEVKAAPREAPVPPPPAPAPVSPAPPVPVPAPVPSPPAALRSSPAARRKARELGLDLAAIPGTGPGGAVTLADVEKAAIPSAPPPPAPPRHIHAVARRMAEALGVDLSRVTGTGVSGAVTKADVEGAASGLRPVVPEAPPRD
ncbi:MAG TPA: E3 binding domain-containing protein, partial [Thermoanaerobaculia bacterium]|nr:E3 binding domain-containing protein [Thermoanaerobaculia bacterium]